jgi:cobalt-zinc-cadmium efflux system outer membrane protein
MPSRSTNSWPRPNAGCAGKDRRCPAEAVPDVTASGGVRRFGDGPRHGIRRRNLGSLAIAQSQSGQIEAAQADASPAKRRLAQARLDTSRAQHDARMLLGAADARVEALIRPDSGIRPRRRCGCAHRLRAGKFSLIELIDAQAALTTDETGAYRGSPRSRPRARRAHPRERAVKEIP